MDRQAGSGEVGRALVLSGGGMRGAYEVGVVQGIVEVLGLAPGDPPPFRAFSGTSVGAINAAALAAGTRRGDLGIGALRAAWTGLELAASLRPDLPGLLGRARRDPPPELEGTGRRGGRALLDVRPIERLVLRAIDWNGLHDRIDAGDATALVVAALEVRTGRTRLFAELAPGVRFAPSRDPARAASCSRIQPAHVLASSALPVVYPARQVGGRWYYDGGLRFNTPLAPVLRMGARRICVVSVRHDGPDPQRGPRDPAEVSTAFLAGKLLDAILLDPLAHDLQVLERTNRIIAVLDRCLSPTARVAFDRMVEEMRGAPWRRVEPLVFVPSRDIGELAARRVEELLQGRLPPVQRLVLRFFQRAAAAREADLASFLLLDGGFADALVELGRADVHARADEVRSFFSG